MKDTEYIYHPQYIRDDENRKPGDLVDNLDWNDRFNLLASLGNNNSDALDKLINTGLLSVQMSLKSQDSIRLNGQPASYYAARHNVLGLDENEYKPGVPFMPSFDSQPTSKKYVDNVFEEYTVKYASGITVLGVYTTLAQFLAEHPKGSAGDAYLVDGNIYVWDTSSNSWYNAGPIQGPQGETGSGGKGVPAGGSVGQLLMKSAPQDYAMVWETLDLSNYARSSSSPGYEVSSVAPVHVEENLVWLKI